MPLPPLVRRLAEAKIRTFCRKRAPAEIGDELRLEFGFRGHAVTIYELRSPWAPHVMDPEWMKVPVAQFRYDDASRLWTLYFCDRSSRWHPCDEIPPSTKLDDLIAEVDEDATGIFWG